MTSTTARKTTRLFLAAGTVAALLAFSAGSALAGEVTGNGSSRRPRPLLLRLLGPGGPPVVHRRR